MAKLYPPTIPGEIPACIQNWEIIIPFTLNPVVGQNEIVKFKLKIKEIQSEEILFTLESDKNYVSFITSNAGHVKFDLTNTNLNIGQFYKVQLSCEDSSDNTGNLIWSNVGIVKILGNIQAFNPGLNANLLEADFLSQDITEKLYSYSFQIFRDETLQDLLESSENIIVNNNTAVYEIVEENEQNLEDYSGYLHLIINYKPQLTFLKELINIGDEFSCYLICKIKTINGYELITSVAENINFKLSNIYTSNYELKENKDNGLVIIKEINNSDISFDKDTDLKRKKITTNEITALPLSNNIIDNTIEQGEEYDYYFESLNNTYVTRYSIENNLIITDFEDIFLSDSNHQLKISYDPKISSFKPIVQEQKNETIGSRYPYFTRNSNIYYYEFPISGLISYNMDENNLFMDLNINRDQHREATKSFNFLSLNSDSNTSLTANNIYKERVFRQEVLKWLSNGEPKLFRSPTEGNFIIRLMNVSLTPNETLGRMIYSFSATATEIDKYSSDNITKYNLYLREV